MKLITLAACVALAQAQWAPQSQFLPQLNQKENRRISRRVGSSSLTNFQISENNLDSPAAGRRAFSPLFVDNTDINDAYLMIDPQRFTIIPAVPPGPHHTRTQKSLENSRQTNIMFPPTSANPSSPVSRNQNNNSINNLAKNPATRPPPLVADRDNIIPSSSSEERKKFRRCHGRCVQKFCLPVGSLSEHAKCQDSCKDICSV